MAEEVLTQISEAIRLRRMDIPGPVTDPMILNDILAASMR
jgi:hypothetical protein